MGRLTFLNNRKQKLAGVYLKNKSSVLLILCHGYKISKDFPAIKNLAEKSFQHGFSVLRFDFTGHGESEGKRGINIMQQVSDIASCIKNIPDKYDMIILIGGSLAAIVTSIAAIKFPEITGLITLNGVFYLNRFGLRYYLFRLFKRKQYDYYKVNFKPGKIRIPTLVIHAKNDKVVGSMQSKKFYSLLKTSKRLELLPEAGHYLSEEKNVEDVAEKVTNWISSI